MAQQPRTTFRAFRQDVQRTRRLLKRMPDAVRDEVMATLEREGRAIEAYGKANAPSKTGRLRSALRFRVFPKTLRARFGIFGRKLNRDLFFGRILEVGRKAQTTRPIQRRLPSGKMTKRYSIRVREIPKSRYDFVWGRAADFARTRIREALTGVWQRALRRAAGD
jgi:hypothetical protein